VARLIVKSPYISGSGVGGYLKYIGTREGVELLPAGYMEYMADRPRSHGLFGDEDNVDMDDVMKELNEYPGNIWTHIISLKREDAERLGYDHAAQWRNLIRAHRNDIASAIMDVINEKGDGKVTITTGGQDIEYAVTREGDKLHFEMTDDGYNLATKEFDKTNANKNTFAGNFNFGSVKKTGVTDADADAFLAALNDKDLGNLATCHVNEGTTPGGTIYGDFSREKAAVVALNLGEEDAGAVADALFEEYGIAVRAGGHCAPRMHRALGTGERGAVRFSFSLANTEEEIDAALRALEELSR